LAHAPIEKKEDGVSTLCSGRLRRIYIRFAAKYCRHTTVIIPPSPMRLQGKHQSVQLWATQVDLRLTTRNVWPDKVALVQSPGGQPKAEAIMHQHFHAVGTLVGKEVRAVGVDCEPHGINAHHASTSHNHWAHWLDAAVGQWI
jgi:hypothetical protein